MAKMPSSTQNRIMVPTDGILPYRICETVMTKKTSVSTEPAQMDVGEQRDTEIDHVITQYR